MIIKVQYRFELCYFVLQTSICFKLIKCAIALMGVFVWSSTTFVNEDLVEHLGCHYPRCYYLHIPSFSFIFHFLFVAKCYSTCLYTGLPVSPGKTVPVPVEIYVSLRFLTIVGYCTILVHFDSESFL